MMKRCRCENCIQVPLESSRAPFNHIRLREDPTYQDREIYFLNASKLVASHKTAKGFSLGDCSSWDTDKIEGIIRFLNPELKFGETVHPFMPRLSVYERESVERPTIIERLLGKKTRVHNVPEIVYGNGRHRSYIMEYLGASFIPVQISSESVAHLRKLLGEDNVVQYKRK